MQRGDGSIRFIRAWLKMALTVFLSSLLWECSSARTGWIEGAARSLYEEDRISFPPLPHPFSSDDPHLIASSLQGIDFLNPPLVPNLTRLAFNSAATRFTSDIEQGAPMWSSESRNPLLAQRTPTLKAWNPSIVLPYSQLDSRRFEANGPTDLSPTFIHGYINSDSLSLAFPFWSRLESDVIQMDLNLDKGRDLFIFANHRLTQTWDMGIVVPVFFGPSSSWPGSTGGTEESGIGDIILQTQYNLPRKQLWWPDVMIGGQVKLPTGDKASSWGTGETDVNAFLIASQSFGRLTPHVNLGFRWTTEGSKRNDFSYAAGLYAQVHPSVTLVLDVLGLWKPNGTGIGDHPINLSLGANWYSDGTFLLNTNILLPLNKTGGYRTDVIWTATIGYLF
jgi:hypothetical protein